MRNMKRWWWIKYLVLVIVFGVWFVILPSDDPGDIVMIMVVPVLFVIFVAGFIAYDNGRKI